MSTLIISRRQIGQLRPLNLYNHPKPSQIEIECRAWTHNSSWSIYNNNSRTRSSTPHARSSEPKKRSSSDSESSSELEKRRQQGAASRRSGAAATARAAASRRSGAAASRTEQQRAEREQQRAERAQRAEEAEQQRQQEQQRAEEADQQRQREQQRAEEAEYQTRHTTLDEYIEACHTYIFLHFAVETDKSLTSKGSITNPRHKYCPTRLSPWTTFLDEQRTALGTLYSVFPPIPRPSRAETSFVAWVQELRGRKSRMRRILSTSSIAAWRTL